MITISNKILIYVTAAIVVDEDSWRVQTAEQMKAFDTTIKGAVVGAAAPMSAVKIDRDQPNEGIKIIKHAHMATRREACEGCRQLAVNEAAEGISD